MLKLFYMDFLDKEIYMEQPERLVHDHNKRFVCKLKEVIIWPEECQENCIRS
jgi:hypothetical protein